MDLVTRNAFVAQLDGLSAEAPRLTPDAAFLALAAILRAVVLAIVDEQGTSNPPAAS